jgi:hypothetical protein
MKGPAESPESCLSWQERKVLDLTAFTSDVEQPIRVRV